MSNQYCKITSWIQHHKDHGDPKYAEAIMDLCLDSWMKPSKYNGLTFLYQTSKTIRKKFCDKVFTPDSREACEDFKRYILPEVFHSCEDFQKKDVGNVLGYKYEVKSCDKHKVVFENGMEIHPLLGHNSFEPLSYNLKDIIRIYYVVKGEPPESGDPYKVHHRKRESRAVGGDRADCERLFQRIIMPQFMDLNLSNAHCAFSVCIPIIKDKLLELSEHEETHSLKNTVRDLLLVQHIVSDSPYGILHYIFYILQTVWNEQGQYRTDVDTLCTNLLNAIFSALRGESDSCDKGEYDRQFKEACAGTYDPDELSSMVNDKMSKMMKAAFENEGTAKDLMEKYLTLASESGKMWGLTLFPVVSGNEKMHALLLYNTLFVCAMLKRDTEMHSDPKERILHYYEEHLLKNSTQEPWANVQDLRTIFEQIPHLRSGEPIEYNSKKIPSLLPDSDTRGREEAMRYSGGGDHKNPEEYFV